MKVRNTTPNIYLLKSGSKSMTIFPWKTAFVSDEFQSDPTFIRAIHSGALVPVVDEAEPAPVAPVSVTMEPDVSVPESEENPESQETPEEPAEEPKKTTRKK